MKREECERMFDVIARYNTCIQLLEQYYKKTNDPVALEAIEKYKKEKCTALMFEQMKIYAERRLHASAHESHLRSLS